MNANDEDPTGGGIARMMEIASGYLRDVTDAIAATPADEHDRFEMLQLKCSAALALATLAQTTVALLDVADEEGDDEESVDDVEHDLAAHDTDHRRRCGANSHAGSSLAGLTCGRRLNHSGMHAQRDPAGELVQW